MAVLNQCNFIGRLGKDPEVKMVGDKKTVRFSIACSEKYKNKATGEQQEKTEWINCSAWDALAGVIEKFVKKGSQVYVSGKFTTRSWDDPATGQKKYASEIVVRELQMLDSKGSQGQQGDSAYAHKGTEYQSSIPAASTATDDDCPF